RSGCVVLHLLRGRLGDHHRHLRSDRSVPHPAIDRRRDLHDRRRDPVDSAGRAVLRLPRRRLAGVDLADRRLRDLLRRPDDRFRTAPARPASRACMSLIAQWREPMETSGGKPPLVVLFHGRGSNEHDLLSIADELPPQFAFAAPRGPVAVDFGGYTWFENRGLGRPLGESLRASVDLLQAWLDGPDASRFDADRIVLFGFSAGMLMASALL